MQTKVRFSRHPQRHFRTRQLICINIDSEARLRAKLLPLSIGRLQCFNRSFKTCRSLITLSTPAVALLGVASTNMVAIVTAS